MGPVTCDFFFTIFEDILVAGFQERNPGYWCPSPVDGYIVLGWNLSAFGKNVADITCNRWSRAFTQ